MRSLKKPVAIDFFSGAGGLSLGFHEAGFRVAAAYDIDPIHVATYSRNFPDTIAIHADVAGLTGAEVRRSANLGPNEEIGIVYGGPPCQGFSLIGKREADDPRNRLLAEFARLVCELRPRYFVIENVAGLLAGSARKVLARTLRLLRDGGYCWVTPIRVLDAIDYGVPQTRKRVIVLGYRKDQQKPGYPKKRLQKVTVRDAVRDLYKIGRQKSLFTSDCFVGRLGIPTRYSRSLRSAHKRKVMLTGCQLCSHSPKVVRRFRRTAPGVPEPVSRFARLHLDRPAPTLRAGTGKDKGSFTAPRPIHPTQPRCITVREAARIHSFPDSFSFNETQWHGFRQIGNSVPPFFARAIAGAIRKVMDA